MAAALLEELENFGVDTPQVGTSLNKECTQVHHKIRNVPRSQVHDTFTSCLVRVRVMYCVRNV